MKVFVVYWHDRYCDAAITVHVTRQSADNAIETHKSLYPDTMYRWTEKRPPGIPASWARYVKSHDDGPYGRILECEVLP